MTYSNHCWQLDDSSPGSATVNSSEKQADSSCFRTQCGKGHVPSLASCPLTPVVMWVGTQATGSKTPVRSLIGFEKDLCTCESKLCCYKVLFWHPIYCVFTFMNKVLFIKIDNLSLGLCPVMTHPDQLVLFLNVY